MYKSFIKNVLKRLSAAIITSVLLSAIVSCDKTSDPAFDQTVSKNESEFTFGFEDEPEENGSDYIVDICHYTVYTG